MKGLGSNGHPVTWSITTYCDSFSGFQTIHIFIGVLVAWDKKRGMLGAWQLLNLSQCFQWTLNWEYMEDAPAARRVQRVAGKRIEIGATEMDFLQKYLWPFPPFDLFNLRWQRVTALDTTSSKGCRRHHLRKGVLNSKPTDSRNVFWTYNTYVVGLGHRRAHNLLSPLIAITVMPPRNHCLRD